MQDRVSEDLLERGLDSFEVAAVVADGEAEEIRVRTGRGHRDFVVIDDCPGCGGVILAFHGCDRCGWEGYD